MGFGLWVLGPLSGSDISKSSTAKTSYGRMATVPEIVSRLGALKTILFNVVVVEVTDDRVLVEYRRWEVKDPAR